MLEVFESDFELIENKDADWSDIPITVGPAEVHNGEFVDDYRFALEKCRQSGACFTQSD